jgi:hypothetical protein
MACIGSQRLYALGDDPNARFGLKPGSQSVDERFRVVDMGPLRDQNAF